MERKNSLFKTGNCYVWPSESHGFWLRPVTRLEGIFLLSENGIKKSIGGLLGLTLTPMVHAFLVYFVNL